MSASAHGRVVAAGCVLTSASTPMAVLNRGGVVPERCSANSGDTPTGGVHEQHPKIHGEVEVGVVVLSALFDWPCQSRQWRRWEAPENQPSRYNCR